MQMGIIIIIIIVHFYTYDCTSLHLALQHILNNNSLYILYGFGKREQWSKLCLQLGYDPELIIILITRKVAIAMHCNLRPPDVAPVVLHCFHPNLYCACTETVTSELRRICQIHGFWVPISQRGRNSTAGGTQLNISKPWDSRSYSPSLSRTPATWKWMNEWKHLLPQNIRHRYKQKHDIIGKR